MDAKLCVRMGIMENIIFRDEGTSKDKAIHSPHQDTPPKYFEHHEETSDRNPFHKCVDILWKDFCAKPY